jgi:competence protein ComEC
MAVYGFSFLKKAPFIKILLSLITGILIQWRFGINPEYWWLLIAICLIFHLGFFFIPIFHRFRLQIINGLIIQLLFFSVGAILLWQKDIRNNKRWWGNYYKTTGTLVVSLDEPLIEN